MFEKSTIDKIKYVVGITIIGALGTGLIHNYDNTSFNVKEAKEYQGYRERRSNDEIYGDGPVLVGCVTPAFSIFFVADNNTDNQTMCLTNPDVNNLDVRSKFLDMYKEYKEKHE